MGAVSWATPITIATALSTEFNSLANGSYTNASTAYNNETGLYQFCDLELVLASLTPTAGGYVAVYILLSVDGTNYDDGGGATAPPVGNLLTQFDLSTSTGAKRRTKANLLLPPFNLKFVALNNAGVALGASANTLKYRLHNATVA